MLRAENDRLSEALGDGDRAHVASGKATLELFGPVPARVSAGTKLELLGLIDEAVKDGWAHARACRVLNLAEVARITGERGCGNRDARGP